MKPVEMRITERLAAAIRQVFGGSWSGQIQVEASGRPDLGDYASPVAFAMARDVRRAPAAIANEIAAALAGMPDDLIETASAAGGYLNMRLASTYLAGVIADAFAENGAIADGSEGRGTKIVIEHTNINPNKAAHVGHFRNACLGDSIARILKRLGYAVEVQNYIDDTGVQVADVVVGLSHLGLDQEPGQPFDRFCSEVYSAVQEAYEREPDLKSRRAEVQHAIESGNGDPAEFARDVTRRIAAANLETMARAGVTYDLLTWESDILGLGFWRHAFEQLRDAGAIRLEDTGPNAGCWVVPFGVGTVAADGKTVSEDKILVTSRGIATYTAKDIAYQLWKFGLLGRDFHYRRWGRQVDGRTLWTSTASPDDDDVPSFAGASRVINVIDATQSYLQQVVYDSLRRLGYSAAADASEHLAYERVVLSPDAARLLGLDIAPDSTKVAMSGRSGVQVLADDLLDQLAERVRMHGATPEAASAVAAGAARYYMLKYSNSQTITFDFDEALRTTGETGVYLQYAVVRAHGIERKLATPARPARPPSPIPAHDRALVLKLIDYPHAMARAGADRSAQTLAKYGFDLAAAFNAFYDNTTPVVQETDPALRSWREGLVGAARLVLTDVLEVLGMPALETI